MVTVWRPSLEALPVHEALTLVVAWRRGKALEGATVNVSDEVADALRVACNSTVEILRQASAVEYGADARLQPTEEYLAVPLQVVDDEADHILTLLQGASALDLLCARDIPARLWFYAVVVGDDPDGRISFLRKADPHRLAKAGIFAGLGGTSLWKIEDPVFILENRFDLVVFLEGLAVLRAFVFETLFRETSGLQMRIPHWLKAITDHLPMDDSDSARLAVACMQSSRRARRLRSIFEGGRLRDVTIAEVRNEIKRQGLDEERLIKDEKLIFDQEDPDSLLWLLNEDFFIGGLSGRRYAADGKRDRR